MNSELCSDYYHIGDVSFYPAEGLIIKHLQRIKLRGKETELLHLLVQNYPNIVSRETLAEQVWNGTYVTDATINQTIKAIRDALDDGERAMIRTIPKKGYVLGIYTSHHQYRANLPHYFDKLSQPLQLLLYLTVIICLAMLVGYLWAKPVIMTAVQTNGYTVYLFQPSQVEQARFDLQDHRIIVERTSKGYRVCQLREGVLQCQDQR